MRIPGLDVQIDEARLAWRTTRYPGIAWVPLHSAVGADAREEGAGAGAGDSTVLIRMAPGRGYPAHRHVGIEEVLVLRGGYRDELGVHLAGDYLRYAAGSAHTPVALGEADRPESAENPACLLYASARGGVETLAEPGARQPGGRNAQSRAMPPATERTAGPIEAPQIEALCRAFDAEFARDPRGGRVAALLGAYAAGGAADWRRYAHVQAGAYTRNLVARTEWYELLVLCWDAGQESPIHNHAGQQCWMAVLEGEIEELHFHLGADGAPPRRGRSLTFQPGRCAYIVDEIALHLVRPANGGRGVSLHLYSRPIDACDVYDPATGQVVRRSLGYYTQHGRAPAL